MKNKHFLLKLLVALLTALLIVSCDSGSKVSHANYDKIDPGMSLTKIKEILGEPTQSKSVSLGTEAIWEGQQASIIIRFIDEKVDSKEWKNK